MLCQSKIVVPLLESVHYSCLVCVGVCLVCSIALAIEYQLNPWNIWLMQCSIKLSVQQNWFTCWTWFLATCSGKWFGVFYLLPLNRKWVQGLCWGACPLLDMCPATNLWRLAFGEICPCYLASDAGLRPKTKLVRCYTSFSAHCLYPCTCAGNGCVTEVHVQLDMCLAQPCHV
jgi:hypothetical protein